MRIRPQGLWKAAWITAIPVGLFAAYYLAYSVWLTAYYTSNPELRHAQHWAYFWFTLTAICFVTVLIAIIRSLVCHFRSDSRRVVENLPNQALLPTPTSVTDHADARSAPDAGAADL